MVVSTDLLTIIVQWAWWCPWNWWSYYCTCYRKIHPIEISSPHQTLPEPVKCHYPQCCRSLFYNVLIHLPYNDVAISHSLILWWVSTYLWMISRVAQILQSIIQELLSPPIQTTQVCWRSLMSQPPERNSSAEDKSIAHSTTLLNTPSPSHGWIAAMITFQFTLK